MKIKSFSNLSSEFLKNDLLVSVSEVVSEDVGFLCFAPGAHYIFFVIHYFFHCLTLHLLYILLTGLVSNPCIFTWPVHFAKLTFIVRNAKAATGGRKVFLFSGQIQLVFESDPRTHCLRKHI